MYLTMELLEKHGACGEGAAWFKRHYPNGVELVDIANNPKVSLHFLHWGFNNLSTSKEEQDLYRKRLNIDCGEMNYSIYESDNVTHSMYVTKSSRVENSNFVFNSKDVIESINVTGSNTIEQCHQIYDSSFCFDSNKVLFSKNITSSNKIINSDYILNSSNVFNGSTVTNSHFITAFTGGDAQNISDSWFIFGGKNLKNCLFCSQLEDAEYYLFNKPVEKIHYDNIVRQMTRLIGDIELELVDQWPEGQIPLDIPHINRNIIKQYSHFPTKFWQWVKTLPGYDSEILYSITYQPDII